MICPECGADMCESSPDPLDDDGEVVVCPDCGYYLLLGEEI